ncbi:NEAT domain-containing protein [Gemella sp.]
MNKKYNNKLIIGLAVPICLSISSVNLNNTKLQLDSNIVYAQDEQSNGFKVYEPEIGASGSLEIAVEGQDTSDTLFKRYWNKIDKLLIDGKDFGFNSEASSSKNYTLYDSTVYISNKDIEAHYNKQKKHKIEFIFKDGSKAVYEDKGYVDPTAKPKLISEGLKILEPQIDNDSLIFFLEGSDIYKNYWSKVSKLTVDGKDFGFDKQNTNSKFYKLYNGQVTAVDKAITDHYKKQDKHKIEFTFEDGSKTTYEDAGYVEPSNDASIPSADSNKPASNAKYTISKLEKGEDWQHNKHLTLKLSDTSVYDNFVNDISSVTLNGTTVNKDVFKDKIEASGFFGIRIFNNVLVNALKDADNKLEIKLVDGTIISYPTSTDKKENSKPTEPKQATPATSASYAQKDLVTKVEKNSYGDELNITLAAGFKAEDVLKDTKEVVINGKTFNKSLFSKNYNNQIVTFDDGGESLKAFKAWNFDGENTIVFKANDGSESKTYTTGNKVVEEKPADNKTTEKQGKKTYSLTDKLEDGEYTLGFNALYADGRQGTSMLEGFFDKNVKLVVKDGKMSITMLNTLFAHGLYDFAIQNKGKWESGVKENFGEKNSAGQYDRALFTLPVEDLDQVHLGGVIVSYMGSLESDKGNFDKYTTVRLKFKPEIKKGWNGFELVEKNNEERKKSDDLLQKKLIANGVDTNKDGKVTEDELKNFTGDINIGSLEIDGKVDKGAIYNLDLLKHMGPGVKSFSSDSNNFGELPEDLFKNAVNIERINLGGNGVTKLPENLFANNKKLKTVNLSSNNLGNIPENLFANNPELESVEFSQSWLSTLPSNVFANNKKLKTVSLSNNKIVSLPNDLFKNNTGLTFLSVTDNELTKLPASVANLTSLTQLYAANNKLTSLPENGVNFTKLNTLALNNNNISSLSDELWKTLAKNKATVRLVNNQISNIPLDLIKANGSLHILDIANNNLPATLPYNDSDTKLLGISPTVTQGYYPQKQAIELNVVAKDNKITIQPKDEKLTILNLLHWYRGRSEFYGGEGILQGLDKYKEFLSKQTKPMVELLKSDDYGRNWYIVTKVERIRGNEVKELSSTSVSNEDDKKLEITDNDMKAGDKYRITKTLFEKNATNIDDKLVELVTTVEADIKKEEPKVEEKPQMTPEQPKVEDKPQVTPEQPKSEEKPQVAPEQPKSEENTLTPATPSVEDNSNLKDTLVAKLPGNEEVIVQFKSKDVTGINFVAQNSDEQKVKKVKELVKNLDEKLNVVKTLDLFFTDDNGKVINKNGETRTVTVAILAKDNEILEVYYVNGDKLEKVRSTYSDGKLTFYTDHFSTYTIVSRAKEAKKDDSLQNTVEQRFNNILPKTGLTENSAGAVLVGLLGVILSVLGFRRKR